MSVRERDLHVYTFVSSLPAEVLIHILEILGSHSIQTAELKQLIGALRPLHNGQLVRKHHFIHVILLPPSLPPSLTAHLLLSAAEGSQCHVTRQHSGGSCSPLLL